MITAAVVGSQICALLLVIALGCTCRLYALRMREQHSLVNQATSPLMRLQEEIYARRLAPPPYNEAMLTSRPFEEARMEYMQRLRDSQLARSSTGQQGQEGAQGSEVVVGQDAGSNMTIPQGQRENTNNVRDFEESDDSLLLEMSDSLSSSSGGPGGGLVPSMGLDTVCDSNGGVRDSSNVHLILGTGSQARWHRPTNKPNETDNLTNSDSPESGQNALNSSSDIEGMSTTSTTTNSVIDNKLDDSKPSSSSNEQAPPVSDPARQTTPSSDVEMIGLSSDSSLESLNDGDTQLLLRT